MPTAVNAEVSKDYFLKFKQAESLLMKEDFSKAEKICDELIVISPEKKWGYLCKASSLIISRKPKKIETLKNLTKVIEIDTESYYAYFMRGSIQFSMRRKLRMCDFIIENNSHKNNVLKQVKIIREKLND